MESSSSSPSAVDAVRCAVKVQRDLLARIEGAGETRIVLRIGIHLGDVLAEAGDIFGDDVNIAARLESLCDPGGILVSSAVRDQVEGRLELPFVDWGERTLKNIAKPVHVYSLPADAIASLPEVPVAVPPCFGSRTSTASQNSAVQKA